MFNLKCVAPKRDVNPECSFVFGIYPNCYKVLFLYSTSLLGLSLQDQKTNIVELALFNVTADPTERLDISHKYPDIVRRLRERIREHQKTAVPPGIVPEDVMALVVAMKNKAWSPWRDTCNT